MDDIEVPSCNTCALAPWKLPVYLQASPADELVLGLWNSICKCTVDVMPVKVHCSRIVGQSLVLPRGVSSVMVWTNLLFFWSCFLIVTFISSSNASTVGVKHKGPDREQMKTQDTILQLHRKHQQRVSAYTETNVHRWLGWIHVHSRLLSIMFHYIYPGG